MIDAARRHGVLLLDGHNSYACAAHDSHDVRLTAEAVSSAASILELAVPDALLRHPPLTSITNGHTFSEFGWVGADVSP